MPPRSLTEQEVEALVFLVEHGPAPESRLKADDRDSLIARGLAIRCVVDMKDGYVAASYSGRDNYCRIFGGYSLADAHGKRMAGIIERARKLV